MDIDATSLAIQDFTRPSSRCRFCGSALMQTFVDSGMIRMKAYCYNYYSYYNRHPEGQRPSHRLNNRFISRFVLKRKASPPVELVDIKGSPQPAVVESTYPSAKSNGSANVRGKRVMPKKAAKPDEYPTKEAALKSDSAEETKDQVLL